MNKYTILEKVGKGTFGSVYKALNVFKHIVAIKVVNVEEEDILSIQKEISYLSQCKNDYIVKYIESLVVDTKLWIVMDYCFCSLRDIIRCTKVEERYLSVLSREILRALSYLAETDVKAANVLLTEDGRVKLCDFGVAGQISLSNLKRNSFVGTPYWIAPEILKRNSYDFKADIWSFGITLYEAANGSPPFANLDPIGALSAIQKNKRQMLDTLPFSAELKLLLSDALLVEPESRPSADELLKYKFVKNAKQPTSILVDLILKLTRSPVVGDRFSIMPERTKPVQQEEWEFSTVNSAAFKQSMSRNLRHKRNASIDAWKNLQSEELSGRHPLLKLFEKSSLKEKRIESPDDAQFQIDFDDEPEPKTYHKLTMPRGKKVSHHPLSTTVDPAGAFLAISPLLIDPMSSPLVYSIVKKESEFQPRSLQETREDLFDKPQIHARSHSANDDIQSPIKFPRHPKKARERRWPSSSSHGRFKGRSFSVSTAHGEGILGLSRVFSPKAHPLRSGSTSTASFSFEESPAVNVHSLTHSNSVTKCMAPIFSITSKEELLRELHNAMNDYAELLERFKSLSLLYTLQ